MGYVFNSVIKNNYFVKSKNFNKIKKRSETFRLYVTFKKRNIFFNITTHTGNSLYTTTTRRQGYSGRRRMEYSSVFSSARVVKTILNKYTKKIALIYSGWHRFRAAVSSALETADGYAISILYIKYKIKIPHNGCRLSKKRGRKFISR